MKKAMPLGVLFVLVVAITTAVMVGQPKTAPTTGDKLNIVVTSSQLADVTRNLVGDRAEIHQLFQPNIDSHDYQPTPTDIRNLEDADLVVANGLGLELAFDAELNKIEAAGKLFVAGEQFSPLSGEHGHEEEGEELLGEEEHADEEFDPHFWFSLSRMRSVVAVLTARLEAIDTNAGDYYRERAAAYDGAIAETDEYITTRLAELPAEKRVLVTDHEVFNYFADEYGFEVLGAVIPSTSTSAEASAQQTAALIGLIKSRGLKAIFAERSVQPKLSAQVAKESGARIVANLYGDALGVVGEPGETYLGMLRYNVDMFVDNLK